MSHNEFGMTTNIRACTYMEKTRAALPTCSAENLALEGNVLSITPNASPFLMPCTASTVMNEEGRGKLVRTLNLEESLGGQQGSGLLFVCLSTTHNRGRRPLPPTSPDNSSARVRNVDHDKPNFTWRSRESRKLLRDAFFSLLVITQKHQHPHLPTTNTSTLTSAKKCARHGAHHSPKHQALFEIRLLKAF